MQQPPGYVQSVKEELVCKLKKSIYGLNNHPTAGMKNVVNT